MILEIGFKNYRMFKEENVLSMKIDKRTKYLLSNSVDVENIPIMKALAIYGPNNSGKTNIIEVFYIIKKVLAGDINFECNRTIFGDNPLSDFYIIFNNDDGLGWLKYEFTYDSNKRVFLSEKITKITFYSSGTPFKNTIFEKRINDKVLDVYGESHANVLEFLPTNVPFLYSVQLENGTFAELKELGKSLKKCSDSIEILRLYNLPIYKTISAFKDKDENKMKFITSFVKAADLSITDFGYEKVDFHINMNKEDIDEKALNEYKNLEEKFKLNTTYGDCVVPSLLFDSTGTKKIEAIASYIYETIKEGKLLIVDELDNGLHYSLTRAIVSTFNNMGNLKGQLIFTAHDLLLIDCKNLLRKDQIYFLSRNQEKASIMSLKKVTAHDEGLREGNSLVKRYNHGDFGKVPTPSFIKELIMLVRK